MMRMSKNQSRAPFARLLIVGPLVFFMGVFWQGSGWTQESPLEVVRWATNQARTVLDNPSYQGGDHRQERIKKMWEVILPRFAPEEIAQRALGVHWRHLTDEQKKHFVHLFIEVVKNTYSGTLDRYTKDAQFFFDSERIEGDFSEVHTRIETPSQDKPVSVVYRLHRKDGQWLVYDVVAENVSMVQNYRNQFSRILNNSSFDGLVQALERKLQELEAS